MREWEKDRVRREGEREGEMESVGLVESERGGEVEGERAIVRERRGEKCIIVLVCGSRCV